MMRIAMLVALLAAPVAAQEAPAALSLEQALELARRHNPDYQARRNDEGVADWSVRSAYASLLPRVSVSGGLSYQGGGEQLIGGLRGEDLGVGETPAYYFSNYSVGGGLQVSGATFYGLGYEKAVRRSVIAATVAAEQALEVAVTRQYLAALRARDAVRLARQELDRAGANRALAQARFDVDAATVLEVRQAEVEQGRAEVELLRLEAMYDTERLRLLQQLGVELTRDVDLTTQVEVFAPTYELETLVAAARQRHPQMQVGRANVETARAGVGMARSAYLPSLSLSGGLSGFTRKVGNDDYLIDQAESAATRGMQDCEQVNIVRTRLSPPMDAVDCALLFTLTDEDRATILAGNSAFPFDFDNQPLSFSLGLSLPVFQGLTRQRQLEAANAQEDDARYRLRADELRIRADVETALLNLEAAYRAVQLEERNRALAADQHRLAVERYRVGAASYLELKDAETIRARAERAYLLGVYAFQEALAALEAAVGQDLTPPVN